MTRRVSDIAFTPVVKTLQARYGSRDGYARTNREAWWKQTITTELAAFIAERDSFYLGTANAEGQPYIQHRGGPKGFLKVLDDQNLAFADFRGNQQYITVGTLSENDKAFIFLMDYVGRRRIKLWGRARVIEDDPQLMSQLVDSTYNGHPERIVMFTVVAWTANCPQHIAQRYLEEDAWATIQALQDRIKALEAENRALREARCKPIDQA